MPPPTRATTTSLLLLLPPRSAAQQAPSVSPFSYIDYSPSAGTVVIVVIGLLFVITAFLSVYLRHFPCSPSSNPTLLADDEPLQLGLPSPARGLIPAVIDTFPSFYYIDVKTHRLDAVVDLECAVCLSEFEDHQRLRLLPMCSHVFHADCIDTWLSNRVTCPVCRSNLEVPRQQRMMMLNVDAAASSKPPSPASFLRNLIGRNSSQPPPDDHDPPGDIDNCGDDHVVVNLRRSPPLIMRSPCSEQEYSTTTMNQNRTRGEAGDWPARQKRSSGGRIPRSRSTGELLCSSQHDGVDLERFTLRLPAAVRKELLSRAAGPAARMNAVRSPRQGFRTRGAVGKSYYERWGLSLTPPFVYSRPWPWPSPASDCGPRRSPSPSQSPFDRVFRPSLADVGERSFDQLCPDRDRPPA